MSPEYDPIASGDHLWVFGYGSLLWNPGFAYAEALHGRLAGHHRALCVYSHRYRGSPERPGLVLGLDAGGSCDGLVFRVERPEAAVVKAYLHDREMVTRVYREGYHAVALADGRRVMALCYLADPAHPQYAGVLTRDARLALVRQGTGIAGANVDYVLNTVWHLRKLGLRDDELEWFAGQLEPSEG